MTYNPKGNQAMKGPLVEDIKRFKKLNQPSDIDQLRYKTALKVNETLEKLMSQMDPHNPTPELNKAVQSNLNEFNAIMGTSSLDVDGIYGKKTGESASALEKYLREQAAFNQAFPGMDAGHFLHPDLKKFPNPSDTDYTKNKQKQWDYEKNWLEKNYPKKK